MCKDDKGRNKERKVGQAELVVGYTAEEEEEKHIKQHKQCCS